MRQKFVDFVLGEGLMPTAALRKIKLHEKKSCADVADILLNRGSEPFQNEILIGMEENIKKAFDADNELVNWLDKVKEFLFIIKNYADADKTFGKMVDEACIVLIKSCPLVSEEIRNLYLENKKILTEESPDPVKNKENFRYYLERKNYQSSTIRSYLSSLNKFCSLGYDVPKYVNAQEVTALYNEIMSNPNEKYREFKIMDESVNKIYTNALRRYIEYLASGAMNERFNSVKRIKIGKIVQTYFREILKNISNSELDKMLEIDYSREVFRTHGKQYPVLNLQRKPIERYSSEPVIVNGKEYYISTQWFEDQRSYLLKWFEQHKVYIGE